MRAEQCVYGRVGRGVSGSAGYQIAALSEGLRSQAALLERLKALSFYPALGPDDAARPRYAFARVGQEHLSFSRTALARDNSGSLGYFSHHLVVRTAEVLAAGRLPFSLLRERPSRFLTAESELPDNRILPPVEISPARPEAPQHDATEFRQVLALARELAADERSQTPVLLSGGAADEEILRVAEQVLALFPLRRQMTLSFCSFFVRSSENLAFYQFVAAPQAANLPEPRSNFRLVMAEGGREGAAAAYFDWLRDSDADPAWVQAYLASCEGCGPAPPQARLEVLSAAAGARASLPAALEAQWPGWAREALLPEAKLFGAYYGRIRGWDPQELEGAFQQRPIMAAQALLALEHHPTAREFLTGQIARSLLQRHTQSAELLHWTGEQGLLDELAQACQRFREDEQRELASILAAAKSYTGQLHRALALRLMRSALGSEPLRMWLLRSENLDRCGQAGVVLRALNDLVARRKDPQPLPDPQTIEDDTYRAFATGLAELLRGGVRPRGGAASLRELLDPRRTEPSMRVLVAAYMGDGNVEYLEMAEKALRLSIMQRDLIVAAIVTRKDAQAAGRYFALAGAALTPRQREQLREIPAPWSLLDELGSWLNPFPEDDRFRRW